MPSLLKRVRKRDDGAEPGPEAAAPAPPPDGDGIDLGPEPEAQAPPTAADRPASQAIDVDPLPPKSTYELPGHIDFDPPPSWEPAPPPPAPPRYSGSLLTRALGKPDEMTPEERDRQAAQEFEQAISPVIELMRAAIPEASTPEEAARILEANQGEITPDPKGGAYVPGDAFDADARVYYRLLRRDYERNPRPSEKRSVSHHLHGAYGKLPGTRGW